MHRGPKFGSQTLCQATQSCFRGESHRSDLGRSLYSHPHPPIHKIKNKKSRKTREHECSVMVAIDSYKDGFYSCPLYLKFYFLQFISLYQLGCDILKGKAHKEYLDNFYYGIFLCFFCFISGNCYKSSNRTNLYI